MLQSSKSCNVICNTFSIESDSFSFASLYFHIFQLFLSLQISKRNIQEISMMRLIIVYYNQSYSPHLHNLDLFYFKSPYQKHCQVLHYIFMLYILMFFSHYLTLLKLSKLVNEELAMMKTYNFRIYLGFQTTSAFQQIKLS